MHGLVSGNPYAQGAAALVNVGVTAAIYALANSDSDPDALAILLTSTMLVLAPLVSVAVDSTCLIRRQLSGKRLGNVHDANTLCLCLYYTCMTWVMFFF